MGIILANIGREEMSESFYATEINDDEMARRFAEFNPRKIQGLSEEVPPDIWDLQLEELALAIGDIGNIKSEPVIQSLKNYAIIYLVTIIEDTAKRDLQFIIDNGDLKIKNLFQRDELHIGLDSLDDLKSDELTKGTIIASNFNFQNPNVIDYVFSKMYKLNFFETLLEFCNLPVNIKTDQADEMYQDRQFLIKNWNLLKEIPELRNKIVHNLNYNVEYDTEQIHVLIRTVSVFLYFMIQFGMIEEFNRNPPKPNNVSLVSWKNLLEEIFGNKFDVYSEIIERQMKNFRPKRFY